MQYNFQYPVYAKDLKDIPERLNVHRWLQPLDFNKLSKWQLKVKMCCAKCEEKVLEEIWEVPGVFDVRASWMENKVVVTAMPLPIGLDEHEVRRKARKIDAKAKFVELEREDKPKKGKGLQGGKVPTEFRDLMKPIGPMMYSGYPVRPSEFRTPRIAPVYHGDAHPFHGLGYGPSPAYNHLGPHSPDVGNKPFYFLFFIIMVLSMYIFRK